MVCLLLVGSDAREAVNETHGEVDARYAVNDDENVGVRKFLEAEVQTGYNGRKSRKHRAGNSIGRQPNYQQKIVYPAYTSNLLTQRLINTIEIKLRVTFYISKLLCF